MDDEKATSENAPKRWHPAWWAEILIAIAVVLVVVGIAIPAYNIGKANARRGEAKAKLHEIRIAIERSAVDTGGEYPKYLIGGSAPRGDNPKHPYEQASDPILRGGYIAAYPRNPFAVPQDVKAMQEQYKDPLCPGTSESKCGYRFGEDYALMGQVLADFRYPKASYTEGKNIVTQQSYADFGYPFWDIYPPGSRKPKPFLPGEFFYKSYGIIYVSKKESIKPDLPIVSMVADIYMLGLYGGPHDLGKDVLGIEPSIFFRTRDPITNNNIEFSAPVWTRSTNKPDNNGEFLGSPYCFGEWQVDYENPNGIPDAVILVLVPGEGNLGVYD